MNIKELNKLTSEILEQEAKKLIMEQIYGDQSMDDNMSNTDVTKFQTLSGLIDRISNIEDIGDVDFGVVINVEGITEDELINTCGGSSFEEAQKNLMQGLHHDLEENGIGNSFDIDIDVDGDENTLNLKIKITTNNDELSGENDMKENTKDTNPTVDKKKDVILGGNVPEIEEKESFQKRTLRLTEEEMKQLIRRIIKEASEPTMDATTEKAISDSGKQNNAYLAAVEKKIKDYLSFKGNDNPKFPNQVGQGEEKIARVATDEEEDVIDLNRGRGPQDLDYDTDAIGDNDEPPEGFKERIRKALEGDPTMGNDQDAGNVVKTDTGKKMWDSREKKLKARKEEPLYPKEAVPVETMGKKDGVVDKRTVNESKIIKAELKRMKEMAVYNKKTQ